MHVPNGSKPVRRDKKSRLKALVFTAKSRVLAACKTLESVKNSLPMSDARPPGANSLARGVGLAPISFWCGAEQRDCPPIRAAKSTPGAAHLGPRARRVQPADAARENRARAPSLQPNNGFSGDRHRFRRRAPPRPQVFGWEGVPHGERSCRKVAQAAERGLVARESQDRFERRLLARRRRGRLVGCL